MDDEQIALNVCPDPDCSELFETQCLLKAHLESAHSIFQLENEKGIREVLPPVPQCPVADCKKVFKSNRLLKRHFDDVHAKRKAKPYQCPSCHKSFDCNRYLVKHMRRMHKESSKPKYKLTHKCASCNDLFRSDYFLRKHMQVVHKIQSSKKKYSDCFECGEIFFFKKALIEHLINKHNKEMEVLNLQFSSMEEFRAWLLVEEKTSTTTFVKSCSKRYKNRINTYYVCNRSGKKIRSNYIKIDERKRNLKSQGYRKIDHNCTSHMVVSENGNSSKANISVEYFKTHYGHENEIEHVALMKEEKDLLAVKLNLGVSKKKILKDAVRNKNDPYPTRFNLLNRSDIFNITKASMISSNNSLTVNKVEDMKDLRYWVKAHIKLEDNPICPESSDINRSTEFTEDFCLIIMTDAQKEMAKRSGDNVICIDSTSNLGIYFSDKVQLITIMVENDNYEGFPIAFCFTVELNETKMDKFLAAVKNQVGIIKCKYFLGDINDIFYNSWIKIMRKPVVQNFYSSWLVSRAWEKNLNKVHASTEELQIEKEAAVYRVLKILHRMTDLGEFKTCLSKLMEWLSYDSDFSDFLTYFKSNFSRRSYLWAYCYRTTFKSNLYIESFYKMLKYDFLHGTDIYNVDKAVEAVIDYLQFRDSPLFRYLTSYSLMYSENTDDLINKLHMIGVAGNFSVDVIDDVLPRAWLLSNKFRSNFFVQQKCDGLCEDKCMICKSCNVCYHTYVCSCVDYLVRKIICKHLHFLISYLRNDNNMKTSSRAQKAALKIKTHNSNFFTTDRKIKESDEIINNCDNNLTPCLAVDTNDISLDTCDQKICKNLDESELFSSVEVFKSNLFKCFNILESLNVNEIKNKDIFQEAVKNMELTKILLSSSIGKDGVFATNFTESWA